MPKINPLQNFNKDETDLRHLQVVYLNDQNFSFEEISKWTGYAVSTIKGYIKKFIHLLDEAKATFTRITKKAKMALRGHRQLVYLYKFYDENGNLICSKVGTTTRLPEERLKEEITYYRQHNIPVADAKICSVIDCGKLPAEGAESITRALFIRKSPKAFCKNETKLYKIISTEQHLRLLRNFFQKPIDK